MAYRMVTSMPDPKERVETRETERGWIALLPDRGLAEQALTRDAAILEVLRGAALVDRLSAKWRPPARTAAT
jgi:hypothetical protein